MSYNSTQETTPLVSSLHTQQQQPHSHSHSHPHSHSHKQSSISQVRDAYERRDILESIQLHNQRSSNPILQESHDQIQSQSHIVGQIGSTIQGVLTTMVIVQTAFAAQVSFLTMLVFVFANALSNSFGNSSNEALQTLSERLFVEGEAAREQWELEVNMEGEIDEMISLYCDKGVDRNTATEIWTSYAKCPKMFLEAMMAAEIGVIYPLPSLNIKKLLAYRSFAYAFGAFVPIFHFLLLWLISNWILFDKQFFALSSLAISLLALFYLGSQRNKGYPITSQSDSVKLNNGLQSLICGVITAMIGFAIGKVSLLFQ